MHITEAYTARSVNKVENSDGDLVSEWFVQECKLIPLCPNHKLCIHLPKDDPYIERFSAAGTERLSAAMSQARQDRIDVMAGSILAIKATAITIHNTGVRDVVAPSSLQNPHYRLSFLAPQTVSSDDRLYRKRIFPRVFQIAHFFYEALKGGRQVASSAKVTIFRPLLGLEPKVSEDLEELKDRVKYVLKKAIERWGSADRERFLRQLDRVVWVLESKMPQGCLGICDVCDGKCWKISLIGCQTDCMCRAILS
jgi:hypothetical protein